MNRFLAALVCSIDYFLLATLYAAYHFGIDKTIIVPSLALVYACMGIVKSIKSASK